MPKLKLKIGLVLDDTLDTPDGVQQYVLTVGKWLARQGHEVHYLVGSSKRDDIDNVHSLARNVKVRFNQNRLSIPLPTRKKILKQKLKELNLDVLHVQMPFSPLFAGRLIAAAPKHVNIVGTFHIVPASWLQSAGAKSLELLTRKQLKRFNSIISVSEAAQSFAKTIFGIDSDVVPNVVSLEGIQYKPTFHKTPTIMFLGRLVERKGCMYLLKALEQLQENYDGDYKVLIAGKGPLKTKLEKYAINKNIKNVQFLGFVTETQKAKLLAAADIAVFPSTGGESFGIVLIEALAAGSRVVLGGDNVGYRSVLGENPELLITPQDATSFASRLQYFLEHPEVRKTTAIWGKSQITTYDVDRVGKKIIEYYQK
jgi:phosphatidylinositol alpha-mannosyltransferase